MAAKTHRSSRTLTSTPSLDNGTKLSVIKTHHTSTVFATLLTIQLKTTVISAFLTTNGMLMSRNGEVELDPPILLTQAKMKATSKSSLSH